MRRLAIAIALASAGALACRDTAQDRARIRAAEEAARAESLAIAADTLRKTFGPVIQLGSFSDENRAKAMRDELEEDGWQPWVSRGTVQGEERWRVNIAPLYDGYKLGLGRLTTRMLNEHGRDALLVEDSIPTVPRADSADVFSGWISTTPVSQRQAFMIGRARWLLSPDSTAMIVMQHNTAIENEPLPNEFIYVSVRDGLWGPRRSWDVAPSPDWRWIAWGKPFMVNPGEQDTVRASDWERVAAVVGLDAATVGAQSFPASGMSHMRGFSQPVVHSLRPPAFRDEAEADPGGLAMAGGWRVRWTLDGRLAAFGANPERAQSDAPAPSYALVDPATGEVRDTIRDVTQLARVPWNLGPTLDVSTPVDFGQTRRFTVGEMTIESREGFVRVYAARDGRRQARVIGPGLALGATTGARFIAALVPKPDATDTDVPVRLVVYQVNR